MMNFVFERLSIEKYKQSKNIFKQLYFKWKYFILKIKLKNYMTEIMSDKFHLHDILMQFVQLLCNLEKIGLGLEDIKLVPNLERLEIINVNDFSFVCKMGLKRENNEGDFIYSFNLAFTKYDKNINVEFYMLDEESNMDRIYHYTIPEKMVSSNTQDEDFVFIVEIVENKTRYTIYKYLKLLLDRM